MSSLLANVEPIQLKGWLEVLFWLVGGALAVVMLVKNLVAKPVVPTPVHVQAAHAPATQQDLKEAHGRIGRERQEVEAKIGEVARRVDKLEETQGEALMEHRREVKEDIRGVHERINQVLHAVGRLEGARK